MNIYLINLPKDRERKAFQKKQFQGLGLTPLFIDAVSTDDIQTKTYAIHTDDWERPLRNVEIACYFSHYTLWKKIAQSDSPALILEDDALLSTHIPQILEACELLTHIDYINLETVGRKKIVSFKTVPLSSCQSVLRRLYLDRNGTGGYILYPSGAQKLIQYHQLHGIALADAHINRCPTLVSYQIEPAAVIQMDQCHQYGLRPPIRVNSNIGNTSKPAITFRKRVPFLFKRIKSQLAQGFKLLYLFGFAAKKKITLRKEDFMNIHQGENHG